MIDLFVDEIQEENEREEFRMSIHEITTNSPQAQVVSNRVIRLLKKVGEGTASAIRDILVDVASEAAKKTLFPGANRSTTQPFTR